jgi:sigma-B regulation protein RsbU (phosphoserine phosphatase)
MRTAVVTDPRLELAWESEVALSLGGDYLDLRQNGETFCLLLADVSGKGPSAALVAAALHALVDEEFSATAGPGAQLKRINERCCELLPEEMFVTCFCAHWNLSDGRISYANAGHESPLLIRSGGNTLLPLSSTGLPLGIDASDSPAEATLQAEPGDVLVAYTDGLIDSLDEHGRRLQPEDVESALRICHDRPAGSILHELKRLSPALRQGQLCDDLLLLVARWKGCPGPHPEN